MRLGFEHSYFALPARFYARVAPAAAPDPRVLIFNRTLAVELGVDRALEQTAAAVFSGNQLPDDATPLAMAYAGHQFGGFVPRLGDGRAILLGEIRDRDGVLRDIQLKGAGQTPFSRNGDGRAALGPMLREYLISEAMHALRIPTTRSLAVVATGEPVFRERELPGAVLTRVAASHVRVGTFQYFAAQGDEEAIRTLLDYVIARHYPHAREADVPALAVLREVATRQAVLIAEWMRVGFIHGVMNTDNMAISGETIDYGPCAFMDEYDPGTVFSSIDRGGRYAYVNQPAIAQWNLSRFAETLLPLIHADSEKAVELAVDVLQSFIAQVNDNFLAALYRKIGLASSEESDLELVRRLLTVMHASHADFTLTFRRLAVAADEAGDESALHESFADHADFAAWLADWRQRLARDPQSPAGRAAQMRQASPAFIPRNHRVDAALNAASDDGDMAPFFRLLSVLQSPYEDQPDNAAYLQPPRPDERVLNTFCGT
ncbi:protein adenylyltransferase SelO [Povalibacter sp.]|uniref:protein adenylyltransferase SelO n=1 Tax=Povalibacter sp. TaxID=1962978 RepID=UPI0032C23302